MPFVHVKLAGKLDKSTKAKLGKRITEVVHEVTGKPTEYIWVNIDDSAPENWIISGEQL
jgi:4-oxalocrotonate tautomerase family enzyme